jgi:hypothetical protein
MAHTSCMLDMQGYTHARTCTHKYVIFTSSPRQQWYANAPQCYVISTLSVLFNFVYATVKILFYFSKFQSISHQLSPVTNFCWRVNRVKRLKLSCLQIPCFLKFRLAKGWGGAAVRRPPVLISSTQGLISLDAACSSCRHFIIFGRPA